MNFETIDSVIHANLIKHLMKNGYLPHDYQIELAKKLEVDLAEIKKSYQRLTEHHALVLHPNSENIWVIHPFSLTPTATWVQTKTHKFWAPCLWCAFGIIALIKEDATIYANLAGEVARIAIHVQNGQIVEDSVLVHFSIPPREAWQNVHHFCACVLPFRTRRDIERWSNQYDLPLGEAISLNQVYKLAKAWYGKHSDENWVKCTILEAQEIFHQVGLTGPFWRLQSTQTKSF